MKPMKYFKAKNYTRFLKIKVFHGAKISYAQAGEDLIVDYIFKQLKIKNPRYLDIGAFDAVRFSNTYRLYKKGWRGVLVEPDPLLFQRIKRKRKGDTCLNVGVGTRDEKEADFYVLSDPALNTFSREESERCQSFGKQKIEKVVKVLLATVNEIVAKNFQTYPNFISLDVEGMDLEILKTFDFSKYRPEVFCIETITYSENKTEKKVVEIIDYMLSQKYFVYADTYINTIFVDKKSWQNR